MSNKKKDVSNEYVWLTPESQTFLDRDYLLPGQTVDQRVTEIADAAAKINLNTAMDFLKLDKGSEEAARLEELTRERRDKLIKYMKQGFYSFSTPIWSNFGTTRGTGISCFGSFMGDTMESILETSAEIGMMSKLGGGTSAYFGELRERGAPVTNNGESSGPMGFAPLIETMSNVVSQGKTRRGSSAVYLPVDHPDILEWLDIRSDGHPIQHLSFGVVVPEGWMQSMIDGDAEKRQVWAKVIKSRLETGMPFVMFGDNTNNNAPDVYKDKGLKIVASNLCLAGDQRVVSDRGYLTAKELYEQGGELVLFDGEKAVKSSPMKLREENAEILKITLENGMTIKVTPDHEVPIIVEQHPYRGWEKIQARDVAIEDRIPIQFNKGLFGSLEMEDEAFLLGLYQSDGSQHGDNILIDIWEGNFDLLEEIQERFNRVVLKYGANVGTNGRVYGVAKFCDMPPTQGGVQKKRLGSNALTKADLGFEKGVVPDWVWKSTESTQWAYLRGLLIGDGTVGVNDGRGVQLQLSYGSIDYGFLEELQLLFNNLGLSSSIRLMRKGGLKPMPDGKGGSKEYMTQDCFRLIVSSKNDALAVERNTGFLTRKGVKLEDRKYRDNTKKAYKVKSIEKLPNETVYCPTVETDEHVIIAQGMLTGNCSEIQLSQTALESFVCCLSSMNLLHFDEWKDTDAVEIMVWLLDAVLTDFINRSKGVKFMERAVRFARNQRALGIGAFGWHSYLMKNMIPFESLQAKMLTTQIFKTINDKAHAMSKQLAEEMGEPELLKGYGRRHVTLTAIAPTKSSSFIIGQASEGIEPVLSNYYVKDLAKIKHTFKNPYLETLLEEKGFNTAEVWQSIKEQNGSVQHLDCLTQDEKEVFRTFGEISQREVVIQASIRQKHIDQSQSLNLRISPKASPKEINALMIEAWQLGVKTLYYQHSDNAAQEFARSLSYCASCEG